jgi:valyl-tRNA synthetase
VALAHPIIPFVTEEIWSYVPGAEGLLAATPWPESADERVDRAAEEAVERQFAAVKELRNWRQQVGVPPGPRLPARLEADGYDELADGIALLARLEWSANGDEAVATVEIPGGAVAVLASEAVDLDADRKRREQRRDTLQAEIRRAEGKLSNQGFVAKAPEAVVQAERDKLDALRRELDELG